MNGARRRSLFALLAVFTGTAVANTTEAAAQRCCNHTPRLLVAVESGAYWAETDELVEARPEYASDLLSHLAWHAHGDVIGISLSYRPQGVLRAHGGMWYLGHTRSGHLVDLDYLDSTSGAVTHRSVSPSEFAGVGWKLATDLLLVEEERGEVFVRAFARLGYRGNYHVWNARGGEYEYPDAHGRFDDDQHLVRYVVRHQAFHAGVFLELGQAKGQGFYGRMGGAVSFLPWVEDRDHARSQRHGLPQHLSTGVVRAAGNRRGGGIGETGGGRSVLRTDVAVRVRRYGDDNQDATRRHRSGRKAQLQNDSASCGDPARLVTAFRVIVRPPPSRSSCPTGAAGRDRGTTGSVWPPRGDGMCVEAGMHDVGEGDARPIRRARGPPPASLGADMRGAIG